MWHVIKCLFTDHRVSPPAWHDAWTHQEQCDMSLNVCSQITELVHQRDMTRELIKNKVNSVKSFDWLMQMRFYFDPKNPDVLQQLSIQMANAKFNYGFEYLGVQDKLVQTPLTDRCYLTMTQALDANLGGSPFGGCRHVLFRIIHNYSRRGVWFSDAPSSVNQYFKMLILF